jgi:hypothetical protein
MSTRNKRMGWALGLGLGAALLAAYALVDRPAEAQQPMGQFCSASSELSPTGRQQAMVVPSGRDPSVCIRYKLGGVVPTTVPDCWTVGRSMLGCVQIVDAPR